MAAVTILGVDGGSRKAGFALLKFEKGGARLFYAELLRLDLARHKDLTLAERLYQVMQKTAELTRVYRPSIVVVEKIRVNRGGRNIDSTMISAQAEAAAAVGAVSAGCEPTLVLANQVASTLRLTGRKREEKKKQTQEKIIKLFGDDLLELGLLDPVKGVQEDIADATALAFVGLTYHNKAKQDGKVR